MNETTGKQFLLDYSKKVNPLLQKYLQEKTTDVVSMGSIQVEAIKRFAEMALLGKKIRGALIVLAYQACGGKNMEAIYEASIFYEIFGTGILVQDDVMDNSDRRRGLSALHKQYEVLGNSGKFGESAAMCIGDFAYFIAMEKLISSSFPHENISTAAKIFTKYAARLALGQIMDLSNTGSNSSEKQVLKVMKIKTAEYTAIAPLFIGAALAGEQEKKKLKALEQFGLCLGWAFQIQDDILGIFGEEKITGKPIDSDLKEGKNTLLMLNLRKSSPKNQEIFKRIFGNKNIGKTEVMEMRAILKESGIYDTVANLGWRYVAEGKNIISSLTSDKKVQAIFSSLLDYTMSRTR